MKSKLLLLLGLMLFCTVCTVATAQTTAEKSGHLGPVSHGTLTAKFTSQRVTRDYPLCVDSLYFTNTTTGGTGSNVYTWYFGDGNTKTTYSSDKFGYKYAYAGTYNVIRLCFLNTTIK